MSTITCFVIKDCHNLSSKLMDRFIMFRAKMCNSNKEITDKYYSSESMAMHLGIK